MMAHQIRDQVKAFCAEIGKDPMLVQGAGGNVSWKEGRLLWVKASGMWLKDALEDEIFISVDLTELNNALTKGNFSFAPTSLTESPLRPSIETLLHGIMPQRIIVHLHTVEILAWLVREDCFDAVSTRMKSRTDYVIVDYFKPGAELAAAVMEKLNKASNSKIVFMKNHGVVIGGDNIQEIEGTLKELISQFAVNIKIDTNEQSSPASHSDFILDGYCRPSHGLIQQIALNPLLYNRLTNDWALYPDHVVFLGEKALAFETVDACLNYLYCNAPPDLVFIKGSGVFFLESKVTQAKLAQLQCYHDVLTRQMPNTKLSPLNEAQLGALLNWEAEKYRTGLSK